MTETSPERQYGREDVDYTTWYSEWARRLAKQHTADEIRSLLGQAGADVARAAASHGRAIAATTSMTSQSQRRAQTRNVVAATGEYRIALRGALEIHELFPEHAKAITGGAA
ncbi:hypothetical protein [Humibacter sp.]|uniref:hypothetical protein n=1 Tax=Humibacter sp. TaxID=1940291 RepID=UPI003F7E3114